ncbi:MAG: hypothetical protein JRJ87_08745 [Deltaproteobacteria bacterium]|nr:hypothetical protein [Deltaproteobacteria bacterium]
MTKLLLIGTVHLDPDGYQQLLSLLGTKKPETITVDVSHYALDFRKMIGVDLARQLTPFRLDDGSLPGALETVAAQLETPFEYRAAEDYAERSGARVVASGNNQQSRKLLALFSKELMSLDNLVALAAKQEPDLGRQVEREWQRAHKQYKDPTRDSTTSERISFGDKRLAKQIREYVQFDSVAHVGGWEHLWNLSELLVDLDPEVRLLNPSTRESPE